MFLSRVLVVAVSCALMCLGSVVPAVQAYTAADCGFANEIWPGGADPCNGNYNAASSTCKTVNFLNYNWDAACIYRCKLSGSTRSMVFHEMIPGTGGSSTPRSGSMAMCSNNYYVSYTQWKYPTQQYFKTSSTGSVWSKVARQDSSGGNTIYIVYQPGYRRRAMRRLLQTTWGYLNFCGV